MNKLLLLFFAFLLNVPIYGQINLNDSTVQVIGYWSKNDKLSYEVSEEKYKIKESDTIDREYYKYTVDVQVVKVNPDSYEIEWKYRDYVIDSNLPILKKLAAISDNMTVRIRTSGLGEFQEVMNWKEIRAMMKKGFKMLRREIKKKPEVGVIMENIEKTYYTKEGIEAGAVSDIRQFYMFHGRKYEYDQEYTASSKVANMLGGAPFDALLKVRLDDIDSENDVYVIRLHQTVDSEQITKASKAYVKKMADSLRLSAQAIDSILDISHNIWVASRIHGTGWVTYSVQTKEVEAEGVLNFDERIIRIKD